MRVLWRFAIRGLRSRPGRALLTLLSIVIGVAAVVSVNVAVSTTRESYKEMFACLTGRASLEVVSSTDQPFPEKEVVAAVEEVKGIAAAVPCCQSATKLLYGEKGEKRIVVQVLGIDPTRDRAVRDYDVVEGKYLAEGDVDAAMLEATFAERLGLKLHDEVVFYGRVGRTPKIVKLPIVALLSAKGAAAFGLAGMVIIPLAKAQENVLCPPGAANMVSLVLSGDADQNQVSKDARTALEQLPGTMVREPGMRTQLARETLATAENGLQGAYALSVVVAVFVIINTFLMNVNERRRQMAILRAVGTTRGQIVKSLLAEGLFLGLIGTVFGTLVGLAGAWFLATAMAKSYGTIAQLKITAAPFIIAGVLGPTLSLVAMCFPAWEAWKVTPLEGMRPVIAPDSQGVSLRYSLLSIFTFVVFASLLAASVFRYLPVELAPFIGAGLTASFVLVVPVLLGLFSRIAAKVLTPILGAEGRIACRQILRRRTRTTLTIGVLYIAVSTGIALGTSIINSVKDLHHWQDQTLAGDFFIQAMQSDINGTGGSELDESLGQKIYDIPGVRRIDAVRFGFGKVGNQPVQVIMRESRGAKSGDFLNLILQDNADPEDIRERMADGEIVVGTNLTQRLRFHVGDHVKLEVGGKEYDKRIAATVTDYMLGGFVVHMDYQAGKSLLPTQGVNWYIVQADPASRDAAGAKIDALCRAEGVMFRSSAEVRSRVDGMLKGIVGSLWGLLGLAFVVSGFGVANTLTMNVLEQTRELALLRVVAASRWQVRKTILAQAGLIGFIGLAAGLVGGMIGAYINSICSLSVTGRLIPFAVYPALFVGSAVFAMVIIFVAALFPAERAARLNLLIALQYE